MTTNSATQQLIERTSDNSAIRPFHVNVPETELVDLRRRINATKWPEREPVTELLLNNPRAVPNVRCSNMRRRTVTRTNGKLSSQVHILDGFRIQ
jgi:hypothetical protein